MRCVSSNERELHESEKERTPDTDGGRDAVHLTRALHINLVSGSS